LVPQERRENEVNVRGEEKGSARWKGNLGQVGPRAKLTDHGEEDCTRTPGQHRFAPHAPPPEP
jgi:hypothetical protein